MLQFPFNLRGATVAQEMKQVVQSVISHMSKSKKDMGFKTSAEHILCNYLHKIMPI